MTILEAINKYLESIHLARSENTWRTYQNALKAFRATLADHGDPVASTPLTDLREDAIGWFAADLKAYSPSTERLYLTAASGFYEYLAAERLTEINLPKVHLLIRQRARRAGQRLPQFPREDIEIIVDYAINLASAPSENELEKLRNLRDSAFMLTLADTGLRVHEACKMRRGDIEWREQKAMIIGKGNREAIVRFSRRSMKALKDYLAARAAFDGASGKPLATLPIFARHDRGSGKKIKPITTRTGQNIINERVRQSLGESSVGIITPHSFRHYFVTTVLRGSGGNLKLAQELARHRNITVTQRYAHLSDNELDEGYIEIFDS